MKMTRHIAVGLLLGTSLMADCIPMASSDSAPVRAGDERYCKGMFHDIMSEMPF